jgi:hypothetical protein
MRFFPVFLVAVACALPVLAEAKVDLKPKTRKLEDPGSATPLLYKTPAESERLNQGAKGAVRAHATCTDRFGTVVKQGDKAYEPCLRNLDKSQIHQSNEKNPNSVGITIGN